MTCDNVKLPCSQTSIGQQQTRATKRLIFKKMDEPRDRLDGAYIARYLPRAKRMLVRFIADLEARGVTEFHGPRIWRSEVDLLLKGPESSVRVMFCNWNGYASVYIGFTTGGKWVGRRYSYRSMDKVWAILDDLDIRACQHL